MTDASHEKTFIDLLHDINRCRGFIFSGMAIGILIAIVVTLFSTPYYKSKMIISPANPMNGAEISSLLADDNLFALRYLVQRVGVANSSDFLRFENIYDGVSVAEVLVSQPDILRGIADDKRWNFQKIEQLQWSAEKLSNYIQKNVILEPVNGTTLRQIVYHHPNPNFAKYFITGIHKVSDALIRKTVREESEGRIAYLQEQVSQTKNPEHRRALTTLLMEQERLLMLASLEQPYAAAIVEKASASHKEIWPNIPVIFLSLIVIGVVSGFLMGATILALSQKIHVKRKPIPQNATEWFDPETANINAKKKIAQDFIAQRKRSAE